MSDDVVLVANPRETSGSGPAGRLRRDGILPAVIYGEGKEATAIQLKEHEMEQLLRHSAGGNLLVSLKIGGGASKKVLLKDVQHHPVTGRLLHADFHSISMTEKLRVNVAVILTGTPSGVSQQGGVLDQVIREIEVECLPTDMLETVEVDVSELNIGDHVNVSDIKLDPSKFTVQTAGDLAIAHVAAPRVEEEPAAAEEAEAAAEGVTEPEVIGEKKEEEGAAEGESGD